MRAAPAVQLVIGPDRGWRCAVALLGAAAAASLAAWMVEQAGIAPIGQALAAAVAAMTGALASRRFLPSPAGRLAWDGTQWIWRGVDGDLQVAIDLGPWLLLRFVPWQGGRVAWLPVGRAAAGAAWHPLRAAVYCRRPRNRAPAVVRTTAPNEPE